MTYIFQNILGMSLTGSMLYLLISAALPVTKKLFSSKWHCRSLLAALVFFLLPVGIAAAKILDGVLKALSFAGEENLADLWAEIPAPLMIPMMSPQTRTSLQNSGVLDAVLPFLSYIWLAGAALFLIFKLFQLARFESLTAKSNKQITDKTTLAFFEGIKKEMRISGCISLYSNPCVSTPMLTGLVRTRLILPQTNLSDIELELVLRHELTHYKNCDLWVKIASMLMCAAHWFNPCAYLLANSLERSFEILCDADVVKEMDREQRLAYGAAILGVLSRASGRPPGMYAAFSSNKKAMKGRLSAMLNERKRSRKVSVFSILVLVLVCAAGIGVSAATQRETGNVKPTAPAPDAPTYSPGTPTENYARETLAYTPIDSASAALDYAERERTEPESALAEDENGIPYPLDFPEGTQLEISQFIWPTEGGYIPAGVGAYPGHTGMDIAVGGDGISGTGTPIFASAGGIVVKAVESNVGYGKFIVVDHGSGYQTLYAHCNTLDASVGDTVEAGQTIATIGRSGAATGAHLHFELRRNGEILDPEDYVNIDTVN